MEKVKKAIGPVVATALIMVVAVVSVVGFQSWYNTYSSDLFVDVERGSEQSSSSSRIDAIIGDTLYFVNSGEDNISVSSLRIGDEECAAVSTLESGMNAIDISGCNIEGGNTNVLIQGDDFLYETNSYLEPNSY